MPVLMFGSWVLHKICRIMDLFSSLVSMLMNSSKLFLFSNEAHLNSSVRLLFELYIVIVIKHVSFFTINLYEINNGICIYKFTFELLHFCFRMWLWFRILILADQRIW